MGEFYAPSELEFNKFVDASMESTGKLASVFGATFQNTRESIRRAKYAEDAGADGVMIAAPYTIDPDLETALNHYRLIHDSTEEIQIMVYNYPPLARGLNMTPEFWEDLIKLDRIVAVKESNTDSIHRYRMMYHLADKLNIFSGGEAWFFSDGILGGKGIVSLFGIAVPQQVLKLYHACRDRDIVTATPLHAKIVEAHNLITAQNEVAFLKATAEWAGNKAGPPRAPYAPLDPQIRDTLYRILNEIKSM